MMRDEELRARFHELRDEDRASVPEFRAMVAGAEVRPPAPRRAGGLPAIWLAVAAGVVLAVGLVLGHSGSPAAEVVTVPTISLWTSPTASLLGTPQHELLAPEPLLSSILDGGD